MEATVEYVEKTPKHNSAVSEIIKTWGSDIIVTRGIKYSAKDLEGILVYDNKKIIGLGLYNIADKDCEIILLETFVQNKGIGTQILEKIKEIARSKKCNRIWLITTNDNIDSMKFYQRRGFHFSNIYVNGFEVTRKIKGEGPELGNYDIPIRDEIEFEMTI